MNKGQLIAYLKANDLWAKRSMGQNFLVNQKILPKIVEAAELASSDTVVEIGPGLGVLTGELVKHAGKVIAIEKDDKLAEALESRIMNYESWKKKVRIINQDVLDLSADDLQLTAYGYKVVANIPYNITSRVIRKFLEAENKPSLLVLMVQKEVAQRICAKSGEMSLLSVSVQFYAEPEIIDIVKAESFFPLPKVDSAIIQIRIQRDRIQNKVSDKDFFRLVKFGFAAKRKTLENNLAAGFHITKRESSDIIKKADLGVKIRAQELSVEDWIKLVEGFYGKKSEKAN